MKDSERELSAYDRVSHPHHPNGLVFLRRHEWDRTLAVVVAPERVQMRDEDAFTVAMDELRHRANPLDEFPVNRRAYITMLRKAVELRWPESYQDDLLWHDARILGVHPVASTHFEIPDGQPFGWILRDMGTHIIMIEGNPYNSAASYYDKPVNVDPKRHRFFWWNGAELSEVGSANDIIKRHASARDNIVH